MANDNKQGQGNKEDEIGEGNQQADRRYREDTEEYVKWAVPIPRAARPSARWTTKASAGIWKTRNGVRVRGRRNPAARTPLVVVGPRFGGSSGGGQRGSNGGKRY